jgi:hypothetical protein
MPFRTFYCFASSKSEADEWVKLLRWKMVNCLVAETWITVLYFNCISPDNFTFFNLYRVQEIKTKLIASDDKVWSYLLAEYT